MLKTLFLVADPLQANSAKGDSTEGPGGAGFSDPLGTVYCHLTVILLYIHVHVVPVVQVLDNASSRIPTLLNTYITGYIHY